MRRDRIGGEQRADGVYVRTADTLKGRYRAFFGASIAAVLLLQVTIVTDTIIVGQLIGPIAMSGVRVASPIVNLLNVAGMLAGVGGSTVVAIMMGRRRHAAANRAFTLTIALSIAIGIVFALVVVPFADLIASALTADPVSVQYTAVFLRIVCAASPVYILASVMAMLLRTDSAIRLSSVVLAMAGVANVLFDLLFIGGFGMGIEGSALATDTGMLVAVLLALLYFRWPKRTLRLARIFAGKGREGTAGNAAPEDAPGDSAPGGDAPDNAPGAQAAQGPDAATGSRELLASIFKNGAPSALRMLFACVALMFLNFVVGESVGVMGIALLTVCGNIQLLAVAFFSAGGQAAIPLEGVLFGERDFLGLRLLVRYVLRIVLACVAVVVIVIWAAPGAIVSLFVPGGLDALGGPAGSDWLLRLYALGFIPLAINYIMNYYYNTIQRRKMSMAVTVLENLALYLPFIWILTQAFGLVGAIASFVAAEALTTAITLVYARVVSRKEGLGSILLVPEVPREVIFDATTGSAPGDASAVARGIKGALDGHGAPLAASLRAAIAVEEMIENASSIEGNRGRAVTFDVRVSALPGRVQVSLRDNGAPFDPTRYDPGERDEFDIDGIETLLAVATRVEYAFTIGMNRTVVEVEEE